MKSPLVMQESHHEPHSLGDLHLTDSEFWAISSLVFKNFGINLTEEKRSLVLGRLQSTLNRHNLNSFTDYLKVLNADRSGSMLSELVNAISTNHTSFFRENVHFSYLRQNVLPEIVSTLAKNRRRDLRIWCAACSTGEEAYTIQMTVMRTLGLEYRNFDAGLLATDISARALEVAFKGHYSHERIAEIPEDYVRSFFKVNEDGSYRVNDRLRDEIMFRRFNLINTFFPFKPFQIIFCRNVMIYFNKETRESLVRRLLNCLEPGGYLFIGASESIDYRTSEFIACAPAVYRKGIK